MPCSLYNLVDTFIQTDINQVAQYQFLRDFTSHFLSPEWII